MDEAKIKEIQEAAKRRRGNEYNGGLYAPNECTKIEDAVILADAFIAQQDAIAKLLRRLNKVARFNDDEFRYRIDIDMRSRQFNFVCEETADRHEILGGSGMTILEALTDAYDALDETIESWGYKLPKE